MTDTVHEPVFVVMLYHWRYNDGPYEGENLPVTAFRDQAAAERERDRLVAEAEADVNRARRTNGYSEFDEADWKYVVVELSLPQED